MLDLIIVVLFFWIFLKVIGLVFRMAWGTAKVIASLLLTIAVPLLVICLVFASGIVLLLPLALVGVAFGLVKACVS